MKQTQKKAGHVVLRRNIVVALDASRNRSGGAKAHLIGMLSEGDPTQHGIEKVHLWTYRHLADRLPQRDWLVVHTPPELEGSLFAQVKWQIFALPKELRANNCDIIFNTDAGSVSSFKPSVVLSQDMLSYEPGEIQRFGWSKARLRLIALRCVQNRSFRRADTVIFLTKHAAVTIQESCGPLQNVSLVPHGIGNNFRLGVSKRSRELHKPIRCVYVSNAALHKHQWKVVEAFGQLREQGYDVVLDLVGGGAGKAQRRLDIQIAKTDPVGRFVRQVGAVDHLQLPGLLVEADIFIFASSCENLPNTLIEGMTVGLPIACAKRGPMPEVLRDGGLYFDPEKPDTISAAVRQLINDHELRDELSHKAEILSRDFSWERCARETWDALSTTYWRVAPQQKNN